MKAFLLKHPRIPGAILFIFGMVVYGFSLVNIYSKVQQRAPLISLHDKTGFFISFSLLGLIIMIGGEKFKNYGLSLKDRKKTFKDYLLVALIVIPGILAHYILRFWLEGQGYTFS